MNKNVGTTDRVIRIVIAAVLAILYFTGSVTGTLGTIFLIVAAILLLTAAFRLCGLYALFGVTTCRTPQKD
ncbi:YgaP family membrane protein [Thermophagus sp. OGC60D27]|uniref:YgaP family membrane protein n=1 Tax=Thermophagus sp. OGC60D27 TaxID=3458415 RepID=UPI00403791CC